MVCFMGRAQDTVAEWLRRWTRNPLGSARVGSNPTGVVGILCSRMLRIIYRSAFFVVSLVRFFLSIWYIGYFYPFCFVL